MLGVLQGFARRRARVADPSAFADLLAAQTAFVSQKSTLDYCRARAGVCWPQLFRESEFGRTLEFCRWEAYAAVLGDVGEVALIHLRRCAGEEGHAGGAAVAAPAAPLAAGVARALEAALRRHPVPAHRDGWDDALAAHAARLHRSALAPPRPVREVGRGSAGRVFEVLPVHTNLKAHDREMVTNNVRFLLCGVAAELERRLDGAALAQAFLSDASAATPPAA